MYYFQTGILNRFTPKLSVLCLSMLGFLTYAEEPEYNVAFLQDMTDQISIDALKYGYNITPGTYEFSIFINNQKVGVRSIKFYQTNKNRVDPCFDQSFIDEFHILFLSIEQKRQFRDGCYDLTAIPNVTVNSESNLQKINLSIPQINLDQKVRGYVSPELYNQGINALILNYAINSNYSENKKSKDYYNNSLFLNGGFNFGAWRYRNQSNFLQNSGQSIKGQNISNKLERDIQIAIPSRLELGDTFSNNDVFDSINFRGIQLSSDLIQLPTSLQNYAPIIRGTAQTNAFVEVRQSGYVVYTANIPPGDFVIDDLYAANESGDLEVTIRESDGRVKKFIQPYSSVPNMQRPQQTKYQFTAGQYRSGFNSNYNPYFGQFTYAYGFNNYLTPYTGVIASENYYSVATGLALSLGDFGALSSDFTYAHNKMLDDNQKDGASFRFLYAKSLNNIGTNIRLVGYRYSTQNYYSFTDAVQERAQLKNGTSFNL